MNFVARRRRESKKKQLAASHLIEKILYTYTIHAYTYAQCFKHFGKHRNIQQNYGYRNICWIFSNNKWIFCICHFDTLNKIYRWDFNTIQRKTEIVYISNTQSKRKLSSHLSIVGLCVCECAFVSQMNDIIGSEVPTIR